MDTLTWLSLTCVTCHIFWKTWIFCRQEINWSEDKFALTERQIWSVSTRTLTTGRSCRRWWTTRSRHSTCRPTPHSLVSIRGILIDVIFNLLQNHSMYPLPRSIFEAFRSTCYQEYIWGINMLRGGGLLEAPITICWWWGIWDIKPICFLWYIWGIRSICYQGYIWGITPLHY